MILLRGLFIILFIGLLYHGAVMSEARISPVLSEVSGIATFSWEIPQGGLVPGVTFFAINPSGLVVFVVLSSDLFRATTDYTDRVTFLGNHTTRNITFTMTNIQTSDAGTYTCGNGGVDTVISNCGQKLIVLGKPPQPLLVQWSVQLLCTTSQ